MATTDPGTVAINGATGGNGHAVAKNAAVLADVPYALSADVLIFTFISASIFDYAIYGSADEKPIAADLSNAILLTSASAHAAAASPGTVVEWKAQGFQHYGVQVTNKDSGTAADDITVKVKQIRRGC
jgi:hypothetical protein